MKTRTLFLLSLPLLVALVLWSGIGASLAQTPGPRERSAPVSAVGTAFTYQGQLKSNTSPVNTDCNMAFRLFNDASAGDLVGEAITTSVSLADGLFNVELDFGAGVFNGKARWLGILVQCAGLGDTDYTDLGRQALTAAPYALALPGLWTEPNSFSPNVIGGAAENRVTDGAIGAAIGGGGGAGMENVISYRFSVIGGGGNNQAGDASGDPTDAWFSTVGGGWENRAINDNSAVVGGAENTAGGVSSFVGGGWQNEASEMHATVLGGWLNRAHGESATIGGGQNNRATGLGLTIGGGLTNTITGTVATIGGGESTST